MLYYIFCFFVVCGFLVAFVIYLCSCSGLWQNLSDSIDNVRLQGMFQKSGDILSCQVVMTEDGKSKGYGFVQFESEECANAAIEKLNDSHVEGKKMYVQLPSFVSPCLEISVLKSVVSITCIWY